MTNRIRITILDVLNDVENLRNLCGFSQRDIAREIGCTRGSYWNWLQGNSIPRSIYEPAMHRVINWMQGIQDKKED